MDSAPPTSMPEILLGRARSERRPLNIGVLSTDARLYSTARITAAGRQRGHTMRVIDHSRCLLLVKKDEPQVWVGDVLLDDLDAVIPRIGSSLTAHGGAVLHQFEEMGVLTTVAAESLRRARNKLRCLQHLAAEGVRVPRTAVVHRPADVDHLLRLLGGPPVVIKLTQGTQGNGVMIAESVQSARSAIESFLHLEADVIVQEYIAEAKGRDLRALVVDGKVVAAMERRSKEGDFRSNLHRGGSSRPIQLSRRERALAIRAARSMALGVAGVDMLRAKSGTMVIEVNASPGLRGIETTTGVDVAGHIIDFVERRLSHSYEERVHP